MRRIAAILVLVLPVAAAETLTPERLEDLAVVREVAIRPDGSAIAYRIAVPRGEGEGPGAPRSQMRLVGFEGGLSRLLVASASDPSEIAWSPDGASLAFVSSRKTGTLREEEGNERIFVLPAAGGEAVAVTPPERKVVSFRWAPKGRTIAYVATEPKPKETRDEEKKKGTDWTVVDRDDPPRRLFLADLETANDRALTPAELTVWEADWSPDASALVAAVTEFPPRIDDRYVLQRVVILRATDGEMRPLLPSRGKLENLRWSPDGASIAFLGATDEKDPSAGTLFVVPASGGERTAIEPASTVNFRRLEWVSPGSILAWGEREEGTVVVVLDPRKKTTRVVADGGPILAEGSISADGTRFAAVGHSPRHPAEVFSGRLGARLDLARRTDSNTSLAGYALGESGPFSWTAADGLEIRGVLIRPVGFREGVRYPLLVTPHGGPEFASLDGWNASYVYLGQIAAARGFLVLLPNYRGSTGRGEAYARANHRDLGGAEFEDVLRGIDALVARGWADPKRVAIAGGSYGGYFAGLGATVHTGRFAAAVVFAGVTNWVSMSGVSDIPRENAWVHWGVDDYRDHLPLLLERSPAARTRGARTPTLILHGETDARVPVSQGTELYTALRLEGVPVEMVVYPRAGHGLTERAHRLDAARRTIEWIERHTAASGGE